MDIRTLKAVTKQKLMNTEVSLESTQKRYEQGFLSVYNYNITVAELKAKQRILKFYSLALAESKYF